jgi:hypothetical protein
VALALAVACALPILAQTASGRYARIVTIQPKEGLEKAFEEGYQRHLEWHRQKQDPWAWYGWQVLSGERRGLFIDGTFGHPMEDFDAPTDPRGDRADNETNVVPYADFLSLAHFVLLPEVSSVRLLEERDPSPALLLVTYRVRPGSETSFESLLKAIHGTYSEGHAATGEARHYTWYKLLEGGEHGTYLLMLPLRRFSQLQTVDPSFPDALTTLAQREEFRQAVRKVHSEVLRYRADLSYFPVGD